MKKHLSVFYLTARESIYRIFFLVIAAFIIQSVLFIFFVDIVSGFTPPSITEVFNTSKIYIVFYALITVIAILLCKTGMQFNSVSGYTLRRLRVRERTVFFWQCFYNFLILFTVVLSEVVLCFSLSEFAADNLPEKFITNQSVYIAFYKTEFIQNLFAGRDILRIIRNIIGVISFSVNCAAFSFLFRRGKKWVGAVIMIPVFIMMTGFNEAGMDNITLDVSIISVSVILTFAAVVSVVQRSEKDEA